jgi:hypothetical protein
VKIPGRFAWHLIEMRDSPAFHILSHSALRVMFELERELDERGFQANGDLACPYSQLAKNYRMGPHEALLAFSELVALGFVEVTDKGVKSGNVADRRPARYRLTYRPSGADERITSEWRWFKTWKDAKAAKAIARTRASHEETSPEESLSQAIPCPKETLGEHPGKPSKTAKSSPKESTALKEDKKDTLLGGDRKESPLLKERVAEHARASRATPEVGDAEAVDFH